MKSVTISFYNDASFHAYMDKFMDAYHMFEALIAYEIKYNDENDCYDLILSVR